MGNRSARCLISLGAIWALLTGVDTAAAGQGARQGSGCSGLSQMWLLPVLSQAAFPREPQGPVATFLVGRASGHALRIRSDRQPRSQPGKGQGWDSKKVGAGTKGKQKCSDWLRSPLVGEDKRTMGEVQIAR